MRFYTLLISALCFISCAEKENSIYVQVQDISLEQPRIKASATIIDSSITVSAELRLEGTEIYYTSDGSEPSKQSLKYKRPLDIKEEAIYKFRAFHPDWKPSDISELKLYKKGVTPDEMNWQTHAHSSYPGLGELTLINQKKGTLNFRDTQWVGYDTIAKALVAFKKNTFLKSMSIGYLVDTKSWIFPPESISVIINKMDTITINIPELDEGDLVMLKDIEIPIEKTIESIEIHIQNLKTLPEWHPGNGTKAWLFMDEWIFNE